MGGDVINEANVQVDRYKREWLDWRSRMDDGTFLRSFLWRIDDPTINVYPKNWVSSRSRHSSRANTDYIRSRTRALRNPKQSEKHGE